MLYEVITIYPELAQTWTDTSNTVIRSEARDRVSMMKDEDQDQVMAEAQRQTLDRNTLMRMGSISKAVPAASAPAPDGRPGQVMQYDPKARTQTGPGMPLWPAYQTIRFSWSGPVSSYNFV